MPVSNLWDLLPECDPQIADTVPYWDGCQWTTKILTSAGAIDCATNILPCVQPSLDILTNSLGNLTSTVSIISTNVNSLTNVVNGLVAIAHTHPTNLGPDFYFGGDGNYHILPSSAAVFYQTIATTGFGVHTQRATMSFGPEFIITDDAVNNRTVIAIDPAYLGGGGGGGGLDCTTVMSCPGIVALSNSVTNLQNNDGQVKVGGALGTLQYLSTNTFDASGAQVQVKTQMSITSDTNGIRLVNDEAAPAVGYVYKVGPTGLRGWYPDVGQSEFSQALLFSNSATLTHNLGKRSVNIVCLDPSNNVVIPGNINIPDTNSVVLTFTPAFTGVVYIS